MKLILRIYVFDPIWWQKTLSETCQQIEMLEEIKSDCKS